MAMDEAAQEALIAAGWEAFEGVMYRGEITLKDGTVKQCGIREIIDVAKFLASKRPPKIRKVPVLDNLLMEKTDGTEEE